MRIEWILQAWSDLSQNNFNLILDTEKIHAGRGVFGPFLVLPVEVQVFVNSFNLSEDVFLISGMIGAQEEQFYSALIIPAQTIGPNRNQITVPITAEQIEAIEQMRNGGAVELRIHFSAVGVIWNHKHVIDSGEKIKTAAALHDNNSWKYMKIEREHWIELHKKLGKGSKKLIEIPEPTLPKKQGVWGEAVALFERVIAAEKKGDFDFAIQESRKVVEGITKVLLANWSLPVKSTMSNQLDSIRDRLIELWGESDRERVKALTSLIGAAWEYTSLSHHYGRGYVGTRNEVAFIIQIISALLVYSGLLLEEKKKSI